MNEFLTAAAITKTYVQGTAYYQVIIAKGMYLKGWSNKTLHRKWRTKTLAKMYAGQFIWKWYQLHPQDETPRALKVGKFC